MRRINSVVTVVGVMGLCLTSFVAAEASPTSAQRGSFPGDNGRIVTARAREGHIREQIVTIAPDGSDPDVFTDFRWDATEPAWSADGSRIVFVKRTGGVIDRDRDVWVMNDDGSGLARVTDTQAPEYTPSWSPDGTRIVFERAGDIFTIEVTGTGVDRLTDTPRHFDAFPTWSPDGARIAFSHGIERSFSSQEIMTMASDGSDKVQVTDENCACLEPSYSPDGSRIAFQFLTFGSDIAVVDTDGTDLAIITDTDKSEFSPVWAPDGSIIAFSSGRYPDGLEISTIMPDGSNRTAVTSSGRTWSDWRDCQPIVT